MPTNHANYIIESSLGEMHYKDAACYADFYHMSDIMYKKMNEEDTLESFITDTEVQLSTYGRVKEFCNNSITSNLASFTCNVFNGEDNFVHSYIKKIYEVIKEQLANGTFEPKIETIWVKAKGNVPIRHIENVFNVLNKYPATSKFMRRDYQGVDSISKHKMIGVSVHGQNMHMVYLILHTLRLLDEVYVDNSTARIYDFIADMPVNTAFLLLMIRQARYMWCPLDNPAEPGVREKYSVELRSLALTGHCLNFAFENSDTTYGTVFKIDMFKSILKGSLDYFFDNPNLKDFVKSARYDKENFRTDKSISQLFSSDPKYDKSGSVCVPRRLQLDKASVLNFMTLIKDQCK